MQWRDVALPPWLHSSRAATNAVGATRARNGQELWIRI